MQLNGAIYVDLCWFINYLKLNVNDKLYFCKLQTVCNLPFVSTYMVISLERKKQQ